MHSVNLTGECECVFNWLSVFISQLLESIFMKLREQESVYVCGFGYCKWWLKMQAFPFTKIKQNFMSLFLQNKQNLIPQFYNLSEF